MQRAFTNRSKHFYNHDTDLLGSADDSALLFAYSDENSVPLQFDAKTVSVLKK